MKFDTQTKARTIAEDIESVGEFEKKGRGTATYSAADAIERVRKQRNDTRKRLDDHAKEVSKGLDNEEDDRHSNHKLAKVVVEGKRLGGKKALTEATEGIDLKSWEGLWGGLVDGGSFVEDDIQVSPIYEEGIRVWAENADELKAAQAKAEEMGFREIKITEDKHSAGPKKWRIDIDTTSRKEG